VLASAATVELADGAEARRWILDGEVVLRGRRAATRLAVPAPGRFRTTPESRASAAG
jgi:hypothetical protein